MNFTVSRGKDFHESFDFKNAEGKPIALPSGRFVVVLTNDTFARSYEMNDGLSRLRNSVNWTISAKETNSFTFNVMYYTLYLDDTEVTRGILRVQ